MALDNKQRAKLIKIYYENHNQMSQHDILHLFAQQTGLQPPARQTLMDLVAKFEDTGSVENMKKPNRKRPATNDENSTNVLALIEANPIVSTTKISKECGISRRSVGRILNMNHFHPYKMHILHELNEDDNDRRNEF